MRRSSSHTRKADFISQGKFDLDEAERLFSRFRETLNAYLWGGIALVHDTLDETRASSSLLTAAILAVTALHAQDGDRAFDICYPIFWELVSEAPLGRGLHGMLQTFQERHALETQQQIQQVGQSVPTSYIDGGVWPDWNSWMFGTTNMSSEYPLDAEQQHRLSFLDALSSQMPG
ncbi:hypothetical protein E4U58_005864 [Claviceps cyperi]|nr:hypothetical protein E4U58_005864 [Claviceps cyperi]